MAKQQNLESWMAMSLTVKLKPIKELCRTPTGYRALACKPIGEYTGLELNKYKNFTLSGNNISDIKLNVEYELDIAASEKSKYPASYNMVGYGGVEYSADGIKIAPEQELMLLRQFTDGDIADNIHSAYPNFVQMIVDGRDDEIDLKEIHNVGIKRFNTYKKRIHERYNIIKFLPVVGAWGISKDEAITTLCKLYDSPSALSKELDENPYHIFYDVLHYSFSKTDKAILKHDDKWIDSKERCEFACLHVLAKNESSGHTRMVNSLLAELVYDIAPETVDKIKAVICHSNRIYYDGQCYVSNRVTYDAEANIADNILCRLHKHSLGFEYEKFREMDGIACTDEQMKILELANDYSICLLRGYAGSGKSTAMKSLVMMLEEYGMDYVQLAPTGKAAKRLRETTGREASTIHMFLTGGNFSADFIIIDECSMIGVDLLSTLFTTISKNTRVVMVCDEAQLASISCGNIVQDMIDSGVVPMAKLTKVFRYGTNGLSTIATDTRMGILGAREDSQFSDYHYIPVGDDPIKQVLDIYESMLEKYSIDDIMVLSAYNKGNAGTIALNNAIQSRFNPAKDSDVYRKLPNGQTIMFKIGDKIINTHNEYNMPKYCIENDGDDNIECMAVMNGDIGYIQKFVHIKNIHDVDTIGIVIKFDNGLALVEENMINHLLLGYAISCHKSQGSQSKAVIALIHPEHEHMITNNLLYVMDSRAEEELVEIGDIQTIERGLQRQENKERNTFLRELLSN